MTDTAAVRRTLQTLRAEVTALSVADRSYWLQTAPSREDCAKYQERQERLKEIRSQINMLSHDTIQSLEPPASKDLGDH